MYVVPTVDLLDLFRGDCLYLERVAIYNAYSLVPDLQCRVIENSITWDCSRVPDCMLTTSPMISYEQPVVRTGSYVQTRGTIINGTGRIILYNSILQNVIPSITKTNVNISIFN